MAEYFSFFDAVQDVDGNYDREYNAQEFTDYFATLITTGVMKGALNQLEVVTTGSSMSSTLKSGKAFIEGRYYINDSDLILTHDTEVLGKNRIDRIVIRLDLNTDSRYVKAFIKKGVPAVVPVAPALQRDQFIYEISLAQVKIIGGQTYININDVVDERGKTDICPWAGSKILPNFDNEALQELIENQLTDGPVTKTPKTNDYNQLTEVGFYSVPDVGMLNSPPQTSATGKVNCTVLVMRTENSDGTTVIHQLAIGYTGTMYIRSNATNVPGHWFDWRKVITGNEPSPVAVVLNAGWTYHATPSNIPTYTKDPLNTVYLTGIVLRASGAGSTIATLPAGYRPSRETRIYGNGDSELSITTDGRIFCSDGRIGQQIAIHISFKATN